MERTEITPKSAKEEAKKIFEKKFSHIRDRMSLEAEKQAIEGCLIRSFKTFLGEELKSKPCDMDKTYKTYSKGYKEIEYFSIKLDHPVEMERIISYANQFFEYENGFFKLDDVSVQLYLKSETFIVISNYSNRLLFTASIMD